MCTQCELTATTVQLKSTAPALTFRERIIKLWKEQTLPRVTRRVFAQIPLLRKDLQGLYQAGVETTTGFRRVEEHALIYKGDITNLAPGQEVLIRINSACSTGDIFHDASCDCNKQMEISFQMLEEHDGPGIVLYHFAHEGKAHGYVSKLASYDGVMYPVDGDRRDFRTAIAILRDLNITRVKVMTNNPEKIKILGEYGIEVTGIVPIIVDDPQVQALYAYKREVFGHYLPIVGVTVGAIELINPPVVASDRQADGCP